MKSFKLSKLLNLTALPIVVIFLVTTMEKGLASGEFSRTCTQERLASNLKTSRTTLLASCKRRDGSVNGNASINLNEYIVNDDGKLKWQRGGQYQKSCRVSQLIYNRGYDLVTSCKTRNGASVSARIRLDNHIANINGVLTYQP